MNEDNPEGSLTEMEKHIVEGCLLGDATMRIKTNSLIEINHSFKQKALVDHLYFVLKRFVITKPKMRRGNGTRFAYRFTTRSLSLFNDFFFRFYAGGKKKIPHDLDLTPVHLAYWLMDDGSRTYNTVYLNTQQFIKSDQEVLLSKLRELHIAASLNKDKTYQRIRIAVSSIPRLKNVVIPYILPEMRYKIP
ncbi:MAG: LAGLIDADG homing endonuclease [Candidatus Amesbacteria bacterium GW2011_GWB1_47_19]|nr:MAG: LAGLIDADG homing endonuclease [Candidatus Amesbacteria bacterium GW2011_GWC1_46_24]KKU66850.1 MAG: LAGLIDADG homing endonuclease [Candidatus Amesbacteria bacterium GW2011_GWB1_47_19]OGD05615.1 MAG: hypothetical protein A2379_00285 [Candidatus Amesbacteria bacterium RIFOXYB1_FULL_47_13]